MTPVTWSITSST